MSPAHFHWWKNLPCMKKLLLAFLSFVTLKTGYPMNGSHDNKILDKVSEEQYDGPYVQYKGDQVFANYILESNGTKIVKTDSIALQQKDSLSLHVMTDMPGKSFEVKLKKKFENEKSVFPKVNNMVVLSDIEGNFGAFRKLLQVNKVIDEDFNWTFGNGNLVLVGDFFDRGLQVTEVLWLIYSLEEKAKAAGGYVHFILGNHEIMNLSGDLRYLPKKYLEDANLLHENYVSLYDNNSELGRWLRTKNIVEKIGNILFTHGGISGEITRMDMAVPEINKLARPYYADTNYKYNDPRSDTIFGDFGPFWYRGYYMNYNHGTSLQIDSTLSSFHVHHIVTGHTIVADTISVWYNGKLLNTDVHHAAGKSEALVIENDRFYRVDQEGKKVLLMEGIKQKH
jgi:hypothetical protein